MSKFEAHIQYPYHFVKGKNLTLNATEIFGLIYDHYMRQKPFFWNQKTMSEYFGVSVKTIERSIQMLLDKKLIVGHREKIIADGGHGGARYKTVLDVAGVKGVEAADPEMVNDLNQLEPDRSVVSKNLNQTPVNLNQTQKRLEPDKCVPFDYIYETNNINLQVERRAPSSEGSSLVLVPSQAKAKVTAFSKKESITREQYQAILTSPSLADNDREFLKWCVEEMADWAASNGKRKADWAATLRNWVRRNLKEKQKFEKRPKTFTEIEDENYEEASKRFILSQGGDPNKRIR